MWNKPTPEILAEIPNLYETEHVPLKDKIIHLHFFHGGCDWFIAESDGNGLMWGYAILNNDYFKLAGRFKTWGDHIAHFGYCNVHSATYCCINRAEFTIILYYV